MPELIEVEQYRRAAEAVIGRRVRAVHAPDAWFLKGGTDPTRLDTLLVGCTIATARRRGKLLLLDTDGPTLGMRFGMTGRLLVDGHAVITELEYGSVRDEPAWDRFGLRFSRGGALVIRDPRRLGGVELDPDESQLGPDAATVGLAPLRHALATRASLKARLLDQRYLAGVGNLLCDEALWRAGIDPARAGSSLVDAEVRRLRVHLLATIEELTERGGSHMGDLQAQRRIGGRCPRDGVELQRRSIGGRTTYSCPRHQR